MTPSVYRQNAGGCMDRTAMAETGSAYLRRKSRGPIEWSERQHWKVVGASAQSEDTSRQSIANGKNPMGVLAD